MNNWTNLETLHIVRGRSNWIRATVHSNGPEEEVFLDLSEPSKITNGKLTYTGLQFVGWFWDTGKPMIRCIREGPEGEWCEFECLTGEA